MVETLKDYAIKALVITVDHLGSVTCNFNDLLDAKVDEVSDAEHRVSCMNRYACILEWIFKNCNSIIRGS